MSNYELKTLSLMSYYPGEPVVGVAEATGKLIVCEEEVMFIKQMGSAIGNMFGVGGMLLARKNAMKKSSTLRFRYDELVRARESRYMGMIPMLVLETKDGEKHSFAGIGRIDEAANIIASRIK